MTVLTDKGFRFFGVEKKCLVFGLSLKPKKLAFWAENGRKIKGLFFGLPLLGEVRGG